MGTRRESRRSSSVIDCGPWRLRISTMRVRVERAWTVLLTLVGVALCFVPLFDVLGYEWCLAMGLVSSLAGAHVGAVRVWRERRGRAPSSVTAAEARPGATVARLWWEARARLYHAAGLTLALAALADHLDAGRLALRLRPRGGRVMAVALVALVAVV